MHIDFIRNESTLTVVPFDHLDTSSSPELQKLLTPELDGLSTLIFDFSNVEYISSSGLRVLLAADQRMLESNGSMKIIHVSSHIMDVFDVTGFREILKIE